MGFTDFVVKYALFFLNFTTTIIGISYIVLATYVNLYIRTLFYDDEDEVASLVSNIVYLTIVGSMIFLITFMGCCGALAEKPCLLNMYAVIMFVLSAVTTVVLVVCYSVLKDIEYTFESIERVYQIPFLVMTLQFIEATSQCCGITGADSYETFDLKLPPTCCPGLDFPPFTGFDSLAEIRDILDSYNRTEHYCSRDTSYEGCSSMVTEIIFTLYHIANTVTILTIAIELIAAIFAFYLAQHIKNEISTKNSNKSYTITVKD